MTGFSRKFIAVSCLLFCVFLFAATVSAQSLAGDWNGTLKINGTLSLKVVFHLQDSDSKMLMDSPDQGAYGIEGETVFISADSVSLKIPSLMTTYNAKLTGEVLTGTFMQHGVSFPLNMVRGEGPKPNRPQTPQPPFPYKVEELKIENTEGGSVIAGTLTIPENSDLSVSVVVMVSGSGQQNRDEELFGHKPFAVLADALARNGIASFRYDDRGIGDSTGEVLAATTLDFASDAQAAVNSLRGDSRFGSVGLLGHSEGGLIGYILASGENAPDFIVSIAGPSIKGSEIIGFQNKMALVKSGVDEQTACEFGEAMKRVLDYKSSHPGIISDASSLIPELYPEAGRNALTSNMAASLKAVLEQETSNPWMEWFVAFDPIENIEKVKVPMFIIFGEKDLQVPPSLNYERARTAAPDARIKVYENLNHLMQHAQNGDVSEYSVIEETMSPEVISDINDFISSLKPVVKP